MAKKKTDYRENFMTGVKLYMADQDLDSLKQVALHLPMPYMTLYKIMQRANQPTATQGILLCRKGGFSANWMFLGEGDPKMSVQGALDRIEKKLEQLLTNKKIV